MTRILDHIIYFYDEPATIIIREQAIGIKIITSFVQYNRSSLPVLFSRVVFRNRTGRKRFVGVSLEEQVSNWLNQFLQ